MRSNIRLFAVLLGVLGGIGVFAGRPQAADALLGSPNYKPSADRPIGWRGDWTGRFPGATPPLQWNRHATGITSELKYQADKPAGPPAAKAQPLEYFTIKDWLVAGPYSVEDAAKNLDKDFLGGEASVEPANGAKAGEATWKYLRADVDTQSRHECNGGTCGNSNVDFVFAFGKITNSLQPTIEGDFKNKAAYAHTYIYAPSAAALQLEMPFDGKAGRFWLNGASTDLDPKNHAKQYSVTLKQGWNRLLVKVTAENALRPKDGDAAWASKWMVAAYLLPVGPVSYQTKNIAWMTPMTGRSMSQPIIVGDRMYVGSGISELLCLDKNTGQILWLRSNTPYDGLSAKQRSEIPEMKDIEPLVAKLEALNEQTVKEINAAVSATGLSSTQQAALDKTIKARIAAERAVHLAFRAVDRKQYPPMYENEVSSSNAVPLSDGKFVYWVCGGGMKGPGAYVNACFDLNGKRIWSRHDSLGADEHGNHMSPNLVEGKLIYAVEGTLLAYDAKTGKELWRNKPDDWTNKGHSSTSPLVGKAGGENVIVHMHFVHRASDGTVVCPSQVQVWGCPTPVMENGVIFNPVDWRGFENPPAFVAVKLPDSTAKGTKTRTLLTLDGKQSPRPQRLGRAPFMVASPLYVDGIVYSAEMGGGLAAVDTNAGQTLYHQYLDGYNRYNRYLYGIAASPTLAGKNIYITDDAGYTHILKPGKSLVTLQRNVLENVSLSSVAGNPGKQEAFYTSPWFEGKRMYLRGEEYLYCIQEQ